VTDTYDSAVEDAFTAFEAAEDNPSLAAAAAKIAAGVSEDTPEAPKLVEPTDGPVTLPAGFRRVKVTSEGTKFENVTNAWVRELNGLDEERIAKARLSGEPTDFIAAVLEAGVEKIGDSRPDREDIDALVLGDRDFLLMQIAVATYGDRLEYEGVVCPHCNESFDVAITPTEEVPVTRLASPEETRFDVKLRKDRIAKCTLPTHSISKQLAQTETAAEANTLLIANFVSEIVGKEVVEIRGDKDAARLLPIVDRQTIIDEMWKRMPGPQYNEVRFKHEPGCGEEVRLEVQLADLFRGL
jgi:hypothetical protein